MNVELTPLEMALARFVAEQRDRDGQKAGAQATKYGYDGSTLELHYRGALGELAFAKGTGRYWSGAGSTYHADDDVGRVQVRVSAHLRAHLIVRPSEEALNEPWVLVIGEKANYRIVGWLRGHEARQERWLRAPADRPAAYFAPQGELRDIQTLPKRRLEINGEPITAAELNLASERMRGWSEEQRQQILPLPKKELEIALLLVSELDARPEEIG